MRWAHTAVAIDSDERGLAPAISITHAEMATVVMT